MGDTSPTPLTENPDERRMFDDWAKLCGSPLKAIAASLTTISKTLPPHGSFSMSLAIYSNEIAKAEATISASSRRVDELREAAQAFFDYPHPDGPAGADGKNSFERLQAALSTTPATLSEPSDAQLKAAICCGDGECPLKEWAATNNRSLDCETDQFDCRVKAVRALYAPATRTLGTPGCIEVCRKCYTHAGWETCEDKECPFRGMVPPFEPLKAITRTRGRTPGTVEVCALCKSDNLKIAGNCPGWYDGKAQDHQACPVKAVTRHAAAGDKT